MPAPRPQQLASRCWQAAAGKLPLAQLLSNSLEAPSRSMAVGFRVQVPHGIGKIALGGTCVRYADGSREKRELQASKVGLRSSGTNILKPVPGAKASGLQVGSTLLLLFELLIDSLLTENAITQNLLPLACQLSVIESGRCGALGYASRGRSFLAFFRTLIFAKPGNLPPQPQPPGPLASGPGCIHTSTAPSKENMTHDHRMMSAQDRGSLQ